MIHPLGRKRESGIDNAVASFESHSSVQLRTLEKMIGHSSISLAVLLYLCVSTNNVQGSRSSSGQRDGKLLSLFQIVRFPNDPCIGNAGKNGTCYTNDECSTKGGSSGGSCAQGYGVCCTFTVNCGGQRSENCTYFESRGGEVGGCIATICPCSNNICQLRLDFDQFTITGPSTSMASIGTFKFGQPAAAGATYTTSSQCLTDSFSVGDPTGCAPPTICGINTNEHMYVDASEACNDLTFALGNQDLGTGIANRQWSIKVTQYSCDYKNLAPDGCTQYFFGPSTDSVQTYNFDGGRHLADQNQNICIRRERGNCRICYTAVLDADFAVNGIGDAAIGANTDMKCCGYAETGGDNGSGYDCLIIPGVRNPAISTEMFPNEICGLLAGLVSENAGLVGKTLCTNRQPFNIRFLSDKYEALLETGNLGFKLTYIQNSIGC